ncbi:MAG: hypothetical protein A7316_00565 [Candidatus Altiarchaeales archaeon WOR_SM1_86-2]|nr:MAG: hypothetical protein A7316_00565 [Candidatus Altiarchaeales archaeon WOR_SM1_86-2]
MAIGVVYGEVKPLMFNILLSNPQVEKGSFVKVEHEVYGWGLARIEAITRHLDKNENEIILANARTIGYKSGRNILVPKTPFKPGEKVYIANNELIVDILGLKKKRAGNIYIGLLEGHDIPVFLDVNKTINKHLSVLAKTGAGKSYTVSVILEELLENDIPIVVIDPHGEYSSLKYANDPDNLEGRDAERVNEGMERYGVLPKSYADKIIEYSPNVIVNPWAEKLALRPDFTLEELIEIMPMRLSDNQQSILHDALHFFKSRAQGYTIRDLIARVELDHSNAKWKVINGLETLRDSGIFEGDTIFEEKLVRPGMTSIINLKGTDPKIQQLIVAKLARNLFEARKLNRIPKFFFLIEEAHNFCPERGFGSALSSNILRTIAGEGRKFGFRIGIVSQRPARVDKNVLSQCNTQIILKVTNPNDLRAIGNSIEGFTSGLEEDIRQLTIGRALVVGECVEQPIVVDVRVRKTMPIDMIKGGMVRESEVGKEEVAEETEMDETREVIRVTGEEKVKKKKKGLWDKIKPMFIEEE